MSVFHINVIGTLFSLGQFRRKVNINVLIFALFSRYLHRIKFQAINSIRTYIDFRGEEVDTVVFFIQFSLFKI